MIVFANPAILKREEEKNVTTISFSRCLYRRSGTGGKAY
jgi:hypothetical protein